MSTLYDVLVDLCPAHDTEMLNGDLLWRPIWGQRKSGVNRSMHPKVPNGGKTAHKASYLLQISNLFYLLYNRLVI